MKISMEIAKHYDPSKTEDKWYAQWMENKLFHSSPDEREPYTVVIPPPNVTGVLHMGHMLNNTIQDILVRKARMQGKNALWVPGTDHASIATEAKVVAKLREEGVEKKDLSREEFLEKAWEWKETHGGIILEQLKKLGASCDWSRTRFTMEEKLSESVIKVFVDLYRKGHIYRGIRMVNWDPKGLTAVSDEEVIHKDVKGKLYYIEYKILDSDETLVIATTRPETILGDTAVCLHPDDSRYKHLKDKKVIVPLIDKPVPIIYDTYIDIEFGTGALKVTPAHDINDYELGVKHRLDCIDILNDDGTLNDKAQILIGIDRFEARKQIEKLLNDKGCLVKTEDISHSIGYSERTNAVIEPKLSMQWFCDMSKISEPALNLVMDDTIKFHPSKFKASYKHWMENVRDWCISRQLWWGQQIPAWYDENGEFVVAENLEEAIKLAKTSKLVQDEDVLDTWFSSWLWPISVFDGILEPDNKDIAYYYPTNDLVTAPEILFFWVARMIMAGYEYRGDKPFSNVYLTGIVRDKEGRKMSKSLGNSPEPLKLIEKYSADGVRLGMLLCSPAGNDLLFDENLCSQGRNFCNKLWNSFRLIKSWDIDEKLVQPSGSMIAVKWFISRLDQEIININKLFDQFRISEALMCIYRLVWDDYCSWYLEIIKPNSGQGVDRETYAQTIINLERLLRIMHPFMPFITEEIWQHIANRTEEEFIVIANWPTAKSYDKETIRDFKQMAEVVTGIRSIRKNKNIAFKNPIDLQVKENQKVNKSFDSVISKLVNVNEITYVSEKPKGAQSLIIGLNEYFVPFEGSVDSELELEKLKTELNYSTGFKNTVLKKLNNENFVKNAPEKVVELERLKLNDAESKIKVIEEQLKAFSN